MEWRDSNFHRAAVFDDLCLTSNLGLLGFQLRLKPLTLFLHLPDGTVRLGLKLIQALLQLSLLLMKTLDPGVVIQVLLVSLLFIFQELILERNFKCSPSTARQVEIIDFDQRSKT